MIKRSTKDILEHVGVIKKHYIEQNGENEVNPDTFTEDLDLLIIDKNLEDVSLIL